jgi:hypothetical protein
MIDVTHLDDTTLLIDVTQLDQSELLGHFRQKK